MHYEIIVAIISGLCVAVPSMLTTLLKSKRDSDLIIYRINELDEKVHKHNNFIERMYEAEKKISIIEEKIKK